MLSTTVSFRAFINSNSGHKVFRTRYGFGIYEGQCDKDGNSCGQGRWVCTEPDAELVRTKPGFNYKGLTLEGCFKDDLLEGFATL